MDPLPPQTASAVISNPINSKLKATQSSPKAHSIAASSHWCASLPNEATAGGHMRKEADKSDSLTFVKLMHKLRGDLISVLPLFFIYSIIYL